DISVPDMLKGSGNLKIELTLKKFADFHPEAIVAQVPRLKKLLEARLELRDLLAKLDGNDDLDGLLAGIVKNTEGLKQIRNAGSSTNAGTNTSSSSGGGNDKPAPKKEEDKPEAKSDDAPSAE
ncbi:MAG: type VI secretion system contractile sheath small subunit, partial [Burkholderiaceae bacterium]